MLHSLRSRWVLVVAFVFCGYATVLLVIAFHSQAQLRLNADSHLVARNQRQASAVSDLAKHRRNLAVELAESHEIKTYLVNKALGMSLRYGLNSSLDAVEQKFRLHASRESSQGEQHDSRLIFFDENGDVLVDLLPNEAALELPPGVRDGVTVTLEPKKRQIIVTAPVMHKGVFGGVIATVGELKQLSRYLLPEKEDSRYHEYLLMADGFEVSSSGKESVLPGPLAAYLATLQENTLVALDQGSFPGVREDTLAVRTPVTEMALSLVTTLPKEDVYGHLTSRIFLYSAAAFPLIILLAAIMFDRMRRKAERLKADFAVADQRRFELQGRNLELSQEMARREALERERLLEKSRQLEALTEDLSASVLRAEAANRAKSLFLSSMSHELRTPLNAVLGYAQLLRMDQQASQSTQESAAEIETAGRHLLALVNDILDLARIESGKLELHPEHVPLSGVLAETRRAFAPQAQERNISLDIPELPVVLYADPVRLRQILFNLISNAIKYNREAGRVSVSGEACSPARYRLTVRDTGAGIAPERLGELFQPFQRIGAEHSSVEGTGIGLVITRNLVEAMGGAIGVESTPGTGSAFWVELPLASGSSDTAASASQ